MAKRQVFNLYKMDQAICRSTGPVDRGRSQSTGPVNRRAQTCTQPWDGGPVDRAVNRPESSAIWKWPRSTGRELLLSAHSPGRPGGRPTESRCSLFPGPVARAVDRWHNCHKNDRWPVARAVDRKVISDLSWLPTGRILRGYKYPSFELVSS